MLYPWGASPACPPPPSLLWDPALVLYRCSGASRSPCREVNPSQKHPALHEVMLGTFSLSSRNLGQNRTKPGKEAGGKGCVLCPGGAVGRMQPGSPQLGGIARSCAHPST